ncbi:CaiB/BaiF CoA transferase family protein [Paracidovorax cattleyae]|uniref:Benzylsuccinate CoA-transferase BbsF subunit n=1 Tax=Paracidovorax cattleyae TaxID=80868 RepID=A0A1H0WAE0_9BURK|nr:CoA transferase [Paracidovorax cattleyae]SDP87598.1 benzylsuccinate CoA-transferase BbsF subunit [Paracidovorax cattleyae]
MSTPQTAPLAGIRVTDFTWIGAGSYTTKILADAGADVVKIESTGRIDSLRLAAPYKDGIRGVNRSGYFADRNSGKRSLTLNMKHGRALELVTRLIRQSDVIANNFTPGVMERFGLGYEAVKAIKPDIVYLAMSMQGGSGPEKDYLGYGATMAAVTGIQHLSGLPGREPAGTGTNYPDHLPNPCHATFAVLAALRHRRRTGQGQHIDMAQTEPTVALLGPAVLDYTVNGVDGQPCGNASLDQAAPYDAFPCRGDDRWIAIGIHGDAQWRALGEALGRPAWMAESRFAAGEGRRAQADALRTLLSAETADRDVAELVQTLQARGIPAAGVGTAADVIADPQLAHRGHWLTLDHPEMGPSLYNAQPFRTRRSPSGVRRPAPLLGQHTAEICAELLGLDDGEIAELTAEGALS